MATQLEKLMFSISLMDRVTGPAGRIQKTISNVAGTAKASFAQIAAGGAGLAASAYTLNALSAPAREFNMAIGEVRSLDVAQESLDKLSDTAISFSIKYGESASDFIKSSYDIQSAIGGLTGDELSSFTNASNILAKGTKADAATITDYMGTMYGIFKNSADSMGKAEWVEQLTGQTATAVQMFKTTGSEMAGAFTSVGAAATSAGIAQAEQIAILGTLQSTMSGSEAGTKYKAFLSGIGSAQEELGLTFTDSAGRMLGMTDILTKLKGKFGETLDVAESDALKKAFGSDEAVGMINLLMADTDGLAHSIAKIGQVSGMEKAKTMASSMVDPFEQFSEGVQAVRIGLGQALLPVLNPAVSAMAEGAGAIYTWTQAYPGLTRWIGYGVVAITGLVGAVVGLRMVMGFSSMATLVFSKSAGMAGLMTRLFGNEAIFSKVALAAWNLVVKAAGFGMALLRGALMAARTGFLWLNAAMLANPVGLIITGVALLMAGVGALIYYWDDLKVKFKDVGWVQAIMGWFEDLAGSIKAFGAWLWDIGKTVFKVGEMIFLFSNPMGWMILLIGSVIHNWNKLKSAFLDSTWGQMIVGWVDRITGAFSAMGVWLGGLADSWRTAVLGWVDALAGGVKSLGAWLWDLGATLIGTMGKIFLFSNPIGWLILGVKSLMSNWDSLKAAFLDSTWGQTMIGWIDTVIGGFQKLTGAFSWVKDKLSWLPGFGQESSVVNTAVPGMDSENTNALKPIVPGMDAENKYIGPRVAAAVPGLDTENTFSSPMDKAKIPETSPSLSAPRRSEVLPGGAGKSIANAITQNTDRSSAKTVNIGQVISNRPANHLVENMLAMGA